MRYMNILDIVNTLFFNECKQEVLNNKDYKDLEVSLIPKRYTMEYEKGVWTATVVLPIEDSTDVMTIQRQYSVETIQAVIPIIMQEEVPEFCFFEMFEEQKETDSEPEP